MKALKTYLSACTIASHFPLSNGLNLLLTNDDGWATAQERATFNKLDEAGFELVLSGPAVDKSGTGSSTTTPAPITTPCEFNTCQPGTAKGSDPHDPRLNWVNGFPVDSVKYATTKLTPVFFGGLPDFVVSGPNIGANAGSTVLISGTVGASTEALKEGIPSIAFSGPSGSHVSYTTLDDTTLASTTAANIYADLVLKVTSTVLSEPPPFLPNGTQLNVNFPSTTSSNACTIASKVTFILTRINAGTKGSDVVTCGNKGTLPLEGSVFSRTDGCFASISVMNNSKNDVGIADQTAVLARLDSILGCLPN
jgi:5'-nucleotidase